MPQLDPNPWLPIMLFSWMVLLIVIFPKTLKFLYPNEPSRHSTSLPQPKPWGWPWS